MSFQPNRSRSDLLFLRPASLPTLNFHQGTVREPRSYVRIALISLTCRNEAPLPGLVVLSARGLQGPLSRPLDSIGPGGNIERLSEHVGVALGVPFGESVDGVDHDRNGRLVVDLGP